MTPREGREQAETHGLDIVEVAPTANPPVCRIMDYGKFRYQQSKRKAASKSSSVSLKTFRLRPGTDTHDLETKLKRACTALEKGDQVKFVMRMRGREHAVTDRWVSKLREVITELSERVEGGINVTQTPRLEGRQIIAMIEPSGQR